MANVAGGDLLTSAFDAATVRDALDAFALRTMINNGCSKR